jgi:probable HAF family extracellular repeat protein
MRRGRRVLMPSVVVISGMWASAAGAGVLGAGSGISAFAGRADVTLVMTVSVGPPGVDSMALGVNRAGLVMGAMWLNGQEHAFVWSGGRTTDLGVLPGDESSAPAAVSDAGEVVGTSVNADGRRRGFSWRSGVMTALEPLPGDTDSNAVAVNAAGQVVGDSDGSIVRAVRWDHGKPTALATPVPGFLYSYAKAINNAGQVAIAVSTVNGDLPAVWSAKKFTVPAGAGYRELATMSPSGVVIGTSYNPSTQLQAAFDWSVSAGGPVRDLGVSRTVSSTAQAINIHNQVVGYTFSDTDPDGKTSAFIYRSGVVTFLGTLGGRDATASALNGQGDVVGDSTTRAGARHAYLWADGAMTDLSPALAPAMSSTAAAVNDIRMVAGTVWRQPFGALRATLWIDGLTFIHRFQDVSRLGRAGVPATATAVDTRP